jgi:DNA-binding transcriptional LysR family regulator
LAKSIGIRMIPTPVELKGLMYEMSWHPRLTTDPAHQWFRDQVRVVARAL